MLSAEGLAQKSQYNHNSGKRSKHDEYCREKGQKTDYEKHFDNRIVNVLEIKSMRGRGHGEQHHQYSKTCFEY
jgi:hypothetical protein